ncbi:MAG: hypothetical protein BZY88_08675 [SAR202 cluster bacterium Io17-Chloro-G9]|nr:MAG: hypothetical protein BZY88_08675 [SAR202 cluster bacterium Io17-Chloro-G9]
MLSLLLTAHSVAAKRIISGWKLEIVLFLGIVLAVALMSSGVIFSNLLAEAALRHTLEGASPEDANIWVRTFSGRESPPTSAGRVSEHESRLRFADERVASKFQPYMQDQSRFLETATFFFQGHPQLELDNEVRPRGQIKFSDGLAPPRITMIEGEWPYSGQEGPGSTGSEPGQASGRAPPDQPLEIAVEVLGADLLDLGVGDRFEAYPASSFTGPPPIAVEIVGIFQRTDPDDEFWFASDSDFTYQNDQWTIVPLFTTEETILGSVMDVYPTLYTDVTWFYYLDRQGISAGDVSAAQKVLARIERDVKGDLRNSSIGLTLDSVLDDYQEQLVLARIPLFLILFLVTGILTYYLALVSGLIVKSRSGEIAMLKSRGSSTIHVGLLSFAEGLLLSVPAVILGPLVALGVVKVLGSLFFGLGGGGELSTVPVTLTWGAWLLGLAGGALAVVVLTALTLVAARQSIVEFLQVGARPPRTPFIHRYYIDVLLLFLVGLLWWMIQSRGSFLVRPLGSQNLELDYSLLLSPVLGLLAIGLVVLRFFPMVLALASRIAEPVGPSWLVHGLRHVSRDPIVPGVLVVLLMFATALGVVGSSFSSTLERSQRDRALYVAGADLRISHTGLNTPVISLGISEDVQALDSVTAAAEVQRSNAHLTTTGFSTSADLLAVETPAFADVAWYRPDFAGEMALEELTRKLLPESNGDSGLAIPADAEGLAVWVKPSRPSNRLFLSARLQDSAGLFFDIAMGELSQREWTRIEAEIEPLLPSRRAARPGERTLAVKPPYKLITLQVVGRFGLTDPGAVFFNGLTALTPNGGVALSDFQEPGRWHVLEDYGQPGLFAVEPSGLVPPAGTGAPGGSVAFSWASGGVGSRGIRPGAPEEPIPALASRSFLDQADAAAGDTLVVGFSNFALPFEIVEQVDFFPTLDPRDTPFLVVDLATFISQANYHSPRPHGGSNELWLELDGGVPQPAEIKGIFSRDGLTVRDTQSSADLVSQRVDRPLITAGWGGLLVLMFMALILASASGLVLFSYMEFRSRQTEFALLRTLGASRGQTHGVAWFSVFLVVIFGVALGTWAGRELVGGWVGQFTCPSLGVCPNLLPLMEIAEDGIRVTPPMVSSSDWTTLLVSYVVIAVVTVGTAAWLAWFTAKMEVQQVLRIGDV